MAPEIEVISVENIKPATPTPPHLRVYKVSSLDQIADHSYLPTIYFYQNGVHGPVRNDTVEERRQQLKLSLSNTLAEFYPFAGQVQGDNQIECNDEGTYYVEARVKSSVSDFLKEPKSELVYGLLPFHPQTVNTLGKTCMFMVQLSIFDCGGIAVGTYVSHKLGDGPSYLNFMNSWAAISRGSSERLHPNFDAPSVFIPDSAFKKDGIQFAWAYANEQKKCVTRRFVFDAKSLAALKNRVVSGDKLLARQPSRVIAATALIWKSALATCEVRSGHKRPSLMYFAVSLRNRSSPPLPSTLMGNIVISAIAELKSPQKADLELPSLVGTLKNGLSKLSNDFVDRIKGKDTLVKMSEFMSEWKDLYSKDVSEVDCFRFSSLCNLGAYETDFGWGKAAWIWFGDANVNIPMFLRNTIFMIDTRSGDGIEAWVTLTEEDMEVFEKDPEIMEFASVDPSPLDLLPKTA